MGQSLPLTLAQTRSLPPRYSMALSLPQISLRAKGRTIDVEFPAGWLDGHPLTVADLEQEVAYLQAAGLRLRVA